MSDKIKRLAKNIEEILPNVSSIQDLYVHLIELVKKQKDYFRSLPPETVVKLLFYVWSLKQTKDYKMGEEMLNKIGFAILVTTELEQYTKDCDYCSGDGSVQCDVCDSDGQIDCHHCDRGGTVLCDYCDGTGEVEGDEGEMVPCDDCGGEGEVSCDNCGGEGTTECPECEGHSTVSCPECEGETTVETDEQIYYQYNIVTWSKFIKDRCEHTQEDTDITMSEYDFDRLRDKYIILFREEEHAEFEDFVQENEMYCLFYDDSPRLHWRLDSRISFDGGDIRQLAI